ncbi:SAND family protein [Aphelenchoides bicaudatus]|nr:SAND family protein [Aphelenchoides bicaudatus]
MSSPSTELLNSLASSSHQIWVLSESGKPIFSSIGNENELASIFGLIQLIVQNYENWEDNLHAIQMDDLYIQFSYRSPLILCVVSQDSSNLAWHLDVIYNQIVSMLSRHTLKRIYADRGYNFDLRRWLDGFDKRVDVCLKSFVEDPVVYLSGFRILPLNYADRDFIVSTMASSINAVTSTVAFAVLIAHRQLIALVRMSKLNLTSSDFNILANLVECHEAFRGVETWVPICLPHFDKNSCLYAHISYLWEGTGPCLIMLSISKEAFFDLSKVRDTINKSLLNYKRTQRLQTSVAQPEPVFVKQVVSIELLHFMYKNIGSSQVCCSSPQKPYITVEEQRALYRQYFHLTHLVRKSKNVKNFFLARGQVTLFAWIADGFELYCIFNPTKMSSMYKIEPFNGDVDVTPKFDFYKIESIHKNLSSVPSTKQPAKKQNEKPANKKNEKPAKENGTSKKVPSSGSQAEEEKLIESLKKLNLKLDKCIEKLGGKVAVADKNQQPKNEKPAKSDKNEGKKSKQEKTSTPPRQTTAQPKPIVHVLKSTASVSYRGLDAILDPFGYKVDQFPAKYQLKLQCQSKDSCWIDVLSKLAQKKGVQLSKSASGDRAIKVEYSDNAEVRLEGPIFCAPYIGHVSVWKSIGTLLGLFDHSDVVISAPINNWLRVADELINDKVDADDVVRKACRHLSSHDFLADKEIPTFERLCA